MSRNFGEQQHNKPLTDVAAILSTFIYPGIRLDGQTIANATSVYSKTGFSIATIPNLEVLNTGYLAAAVYIILAFNVHDDINLRIFWQNQENEKLLRYLLTRISKAPAEKQNDLNYLVTEKATLLSYMFTALRLPVGIVQF